MSQSQADRPLDDTPSTGELVSRVSEQMSHLIRSELRLAQAEVAEKGKKAGLGVGLFGGSGALAFYGLGTLIAGAVLGLANAVAPWLAAVIVAVVLFAVAGVVALVGKKEITQAAPPLPTDAIAGVKADVQTVKESAKR